MGQLWLQPGMLPGFLETLFRDRSCLEMNCGVCQTRLQPWPQSRGSLGPWGQGVWAGAGSIPLNLAHCTFSFTRHTSTSSLLGWRQTGNHCSCLFFCMGNIPCFLGKGANPCSRDSGQWESGAEGYRGPAPAAAGEGKRAHFACERHFTGTETAHEFGSKCGKNKP